MDKRSKNEIKADNRFEASLKDHVEEQKRRTLCFSVRGDQVVFSGEENAIVFAKLNLESITLEKMLGVL